MYEIMAALKALDPAVRIIATGNLPGDEMALRALCAGAKGYIEESASAAEFKQAIRVVHSGSVWASRRVISKFIERVTNVPRRTSAEEPLVFTEREREVLQLAGFRPIQSRDRQSPWESKNARSRPMSPS